MSFNRLSCRTADENFEEGTKETWDLDHREDLSDVSKVTALEGDKVGAGFLSPGCCILVLTNKWLFPAAGLNPQVPDSRGNDLSYLSREQEVRSSRGSLSEQLKCPSPSARSLLFICKDEIQSQQLQDLVSRPPLRPPLQVYDYNDYYFYSYKVAWQSRARGSLLSNFFPSDCKGCANKAERY